MTANADDTRHDALALDFDGVLVDSMPEVFAVAVGAFAALNPGCRLAERPPAPDLRNDVFRRFCDLVPLGNGAADFGVSLLAIEQGRTIADQAAYDTFFQAQPLEWRRAFHRTFYEKREVLRRRDFGAWLRLHSPYEPFLTLLRRRAARGRTAIATAKDGASVAALLDHFGVAELFDPELIVDNSAGPDKTIHLKRILARMGTAPHRLVFVDDKVNHLLCAASMGITPVLAAWGYNTRRERRAARAAGFAVVTQATAADVLFP
jgi:phosphoglycolate phosphatase-like HAD superfamily hydrolase